MTNSAAIFLTLWISLLAGISSATVHHGQEGVEPAAYPLAAYGYDANGNLNGSGYANGVQHAYGYDPLNRLLSLGVAKTAGAAPATTLQGYAYQLDKLGQRTQITEHGGRTITHAFDALHRLTSEAITASPLATDHRALGTLTYTHDAVGNRLTRATTGSAALAALLPDQIQSYTANDRLTTDTYDANGNTISSRSAGVPPASTVDLTDVYSFDNRLIRRVRADGRVIDLTYNPDGHRLTKTVSQNGTVQKSRQYLTDGNNPTGYAQVIEEKDPLAGAGDQLRQVHEYGHDLIASTSRSAGVPPASRHYYTYDGLGSVRGITDENGDLLETYDYDAYGTLIGLAKRDTVTGTLVPIDLAASSSNPQSEFLFTGEQWDDDLGMYFLRARYLNTNTGRFHSQDSYEGNNSDPLTLHKYLYGNGNPVMMTDPSGNFSLLVWASSVQGQTLIGMTAGAAAGAVTARLDAYIDALESDYTPEEAAKYIQDSTIQGALLGSIVGGFVGYANAVVPGSGVLFASSLAITSFPSAIQGSLDAYEAGKYGLGTYRGALSVFSMFAVRASTVPPRIRVSLAEKKLVQLEFDFVRELSGPPPISWPPNRGFSGNPGRGLLLPGSRVDRFGCDGGTFVSPEGIPYIQRSLAPGTQYKPYNVYEVLKPIDVKVGEIAPAFGMPGKGLQLELPTSIKSLIKSGHLRKK